MNEDMVKNCGLDDKTLEDYEKIKKDAVKVTARREGVHAVIDCPYCGKEHRHGWAGGSAFRSVHCIKPKERLDDYYIICEQ